MPSYLSRISVSALACAVSCAVFATCNAQQVRLFLQCRELLVHGHLDRPLTRSFSGRCFDYLGAVPAVSDLDSAAMSSELRRLPGLYVWVPAGITSPSRLLGTLAVGLAVVMLLASSRNTARRLLRFVGTPRLAWWRLLNDDRFRALEALHGEASLPRRVGTQIAVGAAAGMLAWYGAYPRVFTGSGLLPTDYYLPAIPLAALLFVALNTLLAVAASTAWILRTAERTPENVLQDHRTCRDCRYELTGLTGPRCPECGCAVDRGNSARLVRRATIRHAKFAAGLALITFTAISVTAFSPAGRELGWVQRASRSAWRWANIAGPRAHWGATMPVPIGQTIRIRSADAEALLRVGFPASQPNIGTVARSLTYNLAVRSLSDSLDETQWRSESGVIPARVPLAKPFVLRIDRATFMICDGTSYQFAPNLPPVALFGVDGVIVSSEHVQGPGRSPSDRP